LVENVRSCKVIGLGDSNGVIAGDFKIVGTEFLEVVFETEDCKPESMVGPN